MGTGNIGCHKHLANHSAIVSGNYVGNSAGAWRTIVSSLDFDPLYLVIVNVTDSEYWVCSFNSTQIAVRNTNAANPLITLTAINLISKGFKVGSNANNYCNLLNKVYYWVAWGVVS